MPKPERNAASLRQPKLARPVRRFNKLRKSAPDTATPDDAQCSQRTLKLAESDLARSGLTLSDVRSDGIFPTDDASTVNPDFAAKPALIFPYRLPSGGWAIYENGERLLMHCRARYLTLPGFPSPKGRKYDQPAGSGVAIYIPYGFDAEALDEGKFDACAIVEGEKKAIALNAAGIPCIGIGGVDCFRQGKALHPDLAAIASKCKNVYVIFDSDIQTNLHIQSAEWRLAGDLALLGVRVHPVRLPADDVGKKTGADDFLVAHGADALSELIRATPALGECAYTKNDNIISVADILKMDVKPVAELIPQWVEKGVPNFIAGPGGVHKSRLALQWGLCLNAGANVWGYGGGKATLAYYSAEDDENELARRSQAISRRLKLRTVEKGVFAARRGKDSALVVMHESAEVEVRPFYHELVRQLDRIPGHKVVVLDSAYDFVRFAGRAKIDEDAVNYFIKVVLQGVCDLTNSTILIPWHPSQAGSSRGEMDGWSVAWHNAPRARLAISESKEVEDAYELKAVKRNHAPKGQPITLKFHEGALLPTEALGNDENKKALRSACLTAATGAATTGLPLTRQRRIPPWAITEIETATGRRYKNGDIAIELQAAVRDGGLRYLTGTRHQCAGFYPADEEYAKDLARRAKKQGLRNG